MSPVDDVGGLDGHAAFLALHRHAGTVPEDTLGVSRASVRLALQALLADDAVPASAHLELLAALAQADFPDFSESESEYRDLAGRLASLADTSDEQVLEDLKADAQGDVAFLDSATGAGLPHEVTAFFGEDVCHTYRVEVDGKDAVWLFSEFETDAPFKTVAEWVNPENWPKRSPMVFKSMKPTGGAVQQLPSPAAGGESWHGNFEEIVQLAKLLRTELHLDYTYADGLFAGCSYELVRSIDQDIDVDRGFLLVNELGQTRNVKCLKVVGFTDNIWDSQTLQACLTWTHFLKSAVRGGSSSTPGNPQRPHGGYTLSDAAADWYRCVSEAGKRYAEKGLDWMDQVGAGYSMNDAVSDTASLWLSVAQDWANATAEIYANLTRLSAKASAVAPGSDIFSQFFSPGTMPAAGTAAAPAAAAAGGQVAADAGFAERVVAEGFTAGKPGYEGATIAWPGLQPTDTVQCSNMTRLGSAAVEVPAAKVEASVVPIGGGWSGVHVEMPVGDLPAGLYLGQVTAGQKGSRTFQLYVSRATGSAQNG